MASLTESSQVTATTTPQYYTDYLSNLANKGTAAGNAADVAAWNPTALQNQAFTDVASNVGNYLPGLNQAGQTFQQAGGTNIAGAANPYLTAGTAVGGLSQANPYLTTGMAQNTGAAAANPYLQAGANASGLTAAQPNLQAGTASSADLVGGYMSPYVQNVVDQIKLANQQNIMQNLSPGITAGAVGGGQFGSQRGANALALGISNANIGALGQQAAALQAGYSDALKAAQQQRANQLSAGQIAGNLQNQYGANQINAGQIAGNLQTEQARNALTAGSTAGTLQNQANINQVTAGQIAGNMATQQGQLLRDVGTAQANLANQRQTQSLADVNALATLGAQQQAIAQNRQLAPLEILGKQAAVMSGANIPTTTTATMHGSPLSAIAGLGSVAAGVFSQPVVGRNADGTPIYGSNLWDTIRRQFGGSATPTTPGTGTGPVTPNPVGPGPYDLIGGTGDTSNPVGPGPYDLIGGTGDSSYYDPYAEFLYSGE